MLVEIWSDVVCPWCYIGKRRLETALARFGSSDQVEVAWRSFELDPNAPATSDATVDEHLAAKYGRTLDEAAAMTARVVDLAAREGLDFRLERQRPVNTFDAHRLLHLAAEHQVRAEAKEALLSAYFREEKDLSDTETLIGVVASAGVPSDEAREVLRSDAFAAAVRADEARAHALGATGVPFFVVAERYGVSGAQTAELLLEVLDKAWSESHHLVTVTGPSDGGPGDTACDEDGCAI